MVSGGGGLSRDKPLRQPLRSCVRKRQSHYGPSKHAATKRVSINPDPCFLVFNSTATPDLFFADPSTVPSLSTADADLLENIPPLSSLSLGSVSGRAANRVLPPTAERPACEAAEGTRQARLLQEIENLSIGELKDKIREVTMKRRQRQRRLRTAPVASAQRTNLPEVGLSEVASERPFSAGNANCFSPYL